MHKKIILILLSGIVSLALVLLAVNRLLQKENSPAAENIQKNPPAPIDVFPLDNSGAPKEDPGLPSSGLSTGSDLRTNTSYIYSSSAEKNVLEEEILKSFKEKNYPDEINWVSYATKDNSQISLDDFSSAAGIKIHPKLNSLLDQYNYDRFVCKNKSGGLDYGLVLNNRLFDNYPTLSQDESETLKVWEKDMLKDLHKILFPNMSFSETDLGQSVTFKDGKYRYAEISLPEGKKGSINYHLLVDSIVFTNSPECMDQASQSIEYIEE